MYLTCFKTSEKPQKGQTIKIDFVNKIANENINFDKSSTDNIIKFHHKQSISLSLYSLNLKSLEFKVKWINNVNFEDSKIAKAINTNNAFSLLNSYEPTGILNYNCALVWTFKFIDKKADKYYNEFLEEASKVSKKPKCKGIGISGPDDPSVNWNNCVGIKKGSDHVYIGEFVDGYYHGQGIQTLETNEIYVGNFKEDYMDGYGTMFFQADTFFEVSDPFYKKSWILSGEFIEDEWSDENAKPFFESIKELKFK